MAFLKPLSPLSQGNDYFYPLTTADLVIMKGGYRLDLIVGAVKKSTITLYANDWSAEAPYSYSVTVKGLDDNVNMKMLPHFPENFEGKQAMKEETAKISFASRSGNILTFECWDEVPTIDIPVDIEIDITYPGVPDIKINYSVVGGTEEPASPTENMIWVNTDLKITDYKLSKNEPKNPIEGMVWIYLSNTSDVCFHTLNINGKEFDEVYPLSAKLYVSGAWVDKTAMSYQSDEWVEWVTYLYNAGDQCVSITGGWGTEGYSYPSNDVVAGTLGTSSMSLYRVGNGDIHTLGTINKVDFTDKKTLIVEVTEVTKIGAYPNLNISSTKEKPSDVVIAQKQITETGLVSIDITDIDSGYVSVTCNAGDGTLTITNIWMI